MPWVVDKDSDSFRQVVDKVADVYKLIVEPMTLEIKSLMRDYLTLSEAELFCAESESKACDKSVSDKIIGDNSKNMADVIEARNK